ncbi:MAG: hypothetical protein ACI4OL_03635 [Gemmiger sp.]
MLREILAVLLSFAFCAVLMAGCASGAASGKPAESAVVSTAVSTGLMEEELATPETSEKEEYSESDLRDALDATISYGADTAGGSLKAVIAAAGLVEFFATQCGPEDAVSLVTDTADWYGELTDDQRATLALNWPVIYDEVVLLVEDPASQTEILSEAGVTTDFTRLDMVAPAEILVALNALLTK